MVERLTNKILAAFREFGEPRFSREVSDVQEYSIKVIGHVETDFKEKFGIPRQSGIVKSAAGKIVFEPEFKNTDALRGLDGYSHLWIIWQFSEAVRDTWSPTVRPPRMGGNKRMGVFATRSPFRPNSLGLSCVRIKRIDFENAEIYVSGIDMLDGTPIFDIKPYLPYVDSKTDAVGGFADEYKEYALEVSITDELLCMLPGEHRETVIDILSGDPRPSYQNDPTRIYGMNFADYNIKFTVDNGVLTVLEIE